MKKLLLSGGILCILALPAWAATAITVVNIGSVFNESLPLPAEDTPGSGGAFEQFFEFSLPVTQSVTVSMSDSATGSQRITGGVLGLNFWTTTGPLPDLIPMGALIDSSPIANFIGGQSATVGPDVLGAGNYFAEISGTSGSSRIMIAVDGTVTAVGSVPEIPTWAMTLAGFGLIGLVGVARRSSRYAAI